jgi:hypothetical protein
METWKSSSHPSLPPATWQLVSSDPLGGVADGDKHRSWANSEQNSLCRGSEGQSEISMGGAERCHGTKRTHSQEVNPHEDGKDAPVNLALDDFALAPHDCCTLLVNEVHANKKAYLPAHASSVPSGKHHPKPSWQHHPRPVGGGCWRGSLCGAAWPWTGVSR